MEKKIVKKNRKLIIIGTGEFGEIAYEYFTMDSDYEVIAFAVEKQYRDKKTFFGLPVIDFENIQQLYPPAQYEAFVAITYVKLNRVRRRLFMECRERGYHCASYISSCAFVWHNVKIGENVFIFEKSIVQYHVEMGDNVNIWSGSYVGHSSMIEDDCWIAPNVVVSGFCKIGKGSFLGANSTLGDNVVLAKDTILGAASITVKSLQEEAGVYVGSPARKLDRTSYQQFDLEDKDMDLFNGTSGG